MGLRTQKRRRRENKTDYKKRLNLLKAGKKRIVIRKTNKYLIVQLVESVEAKDRVITGMTSKELLKHGWDKKFSGSLKSIPAAYLIGKLFAKKLPKEELIVDLGMARKSYGSRLFSVVKGLVDGGANIKYNEKVFPDESRIRGEHQNPEIKNMLKNIKI